MEEENIPLTEKDAPSTLLKIKYRWVILAIFSLYSFIQIAVRDTWGPISSSANVAIGFTPHDYDLLSNWAPIGVLPSMPFFIWLINAKGARLPVLIGAILVAVGTGLRCLPLDAVSLRYFIHAGQLLNAIAGCSVLGAVPLISNIWFPPSERITATSCMLLLGNLGNAFSYLIGPAIVETPNNCTTDITTTSSVNMMYRMAKSVFTSAPSTPALLFTTICTDNTKEMRQQINTLMYSEFAFAVVVLILIVFFFHNKPALPPSASAATERLQILAGLKVLIRRKTYWCVVVLYSLVMGSYYGWYGIITILLAPQGLSEKEVGFAAFVMTVAGTVVGIVVGWFTDRMKGRMKWTLFGIIALKVVVFLYLVIIIMDWISLVPFRFSRTGFWISFVIFGCLASAMQPIGMELAADIAFPVQEGVSTSVLVWFVTWSMFIFLTVLDSVQDQNIANYMVLGITGLAAPVIAFFAPDQNTRLQIDTEQQLNLDDDDDDPVSVQNMLVNI